MASLCQNDRGIDIIVNVYDLHDSNSYLYSVGTGFYHTGVQIQDFEYCFSEHGVVRTKPMDAGLGRFLGSMQGIKEILMQMRKGDFAPGEYHILRLNCNHFSDKLVNILLGSNIPLWINRLAELGSTLSLDQLGVISATETKEEIESNKIRSQIPNDGFISSNFFSQSMISSTDPVDLFSSSMSSVFQVLCFAPSADMVCDDEVLVTQSPSHHMLPQQLNVHRIASSNLESTDLRG